MKVAIVSDTLPGYHRHWSGAELIAVSLSDLLKERGCHPYFITSAFDLQPAEQKYDVFAIKTPLKSLGTISRNFPLDLVALKAMLGNLRRQKPAIVHINAKYLFLPAVIACRMLKIPSVFTVADYYIFCPTTFLRKPDGSICENNHGAQCQKCLSALGDSRINRLISRMPGILAGGVLGLRAFEFNAVLRRVSAFVTLSETSRQRLVKCGIPPAKVKVIYHYRLSEPAETNVAVEHPAIVFAGWLTRENGTDILAEAFSLIAAIISGARLYLAGTGDDAFVSGIKQKLRRAGLSDRVVFLGKRDNRETLAIIAKCDVAVVPHQWPKEFGPVILVEALALGKPVITSAIGATHEFVKDGENGFLVKDYTNPMAFAERIMDLFSDMDRLGVMAQKAKKSTGFLRDGSAGSEMVKLYASLVKSA